MKAQIALTGASGAMGEEVLASLLQSERNHKVRIILFEQEKSVSPYLKRLMKKYKARLDLFKGDIARYEDCVRLVEGVDYVLHCAAIIPPKSDHNAKQTYLSNYVGVKNIVDAIEHSGRKEEIKLVHVATVAMYGHRGYPHIWGRVGDPMISSDYDSYSMWKMKGERYVLESDLPHYVSLRQTAVLHKYMFANNLKDGLMFHTSFNAPLEWASDLDCGVLCRNLVEFDLDGKLDGFWNRCYNIGGGESCRVTGFETLDAGFRLMGKGAKDFFEPNWNIPRNFHGVWYVDSDVLESYLHFRKESCEAFWKRMGKKYWYYKLGSIVPAWMIKKFLFDPLRKRNTNSPTYWVEYKKDGRVKAFFGGYDRYASISKDWKEYPLLSEGLTPDFKQIDYQTLRRMPVNLLDHGYDESKTELTIEDMQSVASFRSGECLSDTMQDLSSKLVWKCHNGHTFSAKAYTIVKGGYWCPECCEPKPWAYGTLAKKIPFYAQLYYDTHTKEEENDVYPLYEGEDDFIETK